MTGPTPVPRWTRASVPLVAGKDSSANRAVVNAMTECQKTTGMTALEIAGQPAALADLRDDLDNGTPSDVVLIAVPAGKGAAVEEWLRWQFFGGRPPA